MTMTKVNVQGHILNRRTRNMLRVAEQRLGRNLEILQGSYNTTVDESAGTHAGGGAVDIAPTNHPREVVLALRSVGFAAWHRTPSQGPWVEHIHAIAIGDGDMSAAAHAQVRAYFDGRNGLANNGRDDGPRIHPIPKWPIKRPRVFYITAWHQMHAKRPARRNAVKAMQHCLNKRFDARLVVDGKLGPVTKRAYYKHYKRFGRKNFWRLLAGYYRVV